MVALLFLLVVTVISVIAASNSAIGLKMSANLQDSYSSFQSAEAGIMAVLSLAGTANDPFDGGLMTEDPFAGVVTEIPWRGLKDGQARWTSMSFSRPPRPPARECRVASSVGLFDCDYYRITSEHEVAKGGPHQGRAGRGENNYWQWHPISRGGASGAEGGNEWFGGYAHDEREMEKMAARLWLPASWC